LALLICSGLGAFAASDGWETIEVYRGAQLDFTRNITREEDRAAIQAAGDRWLDAMEVERPRLFPLASAELVLGLGMFVFAAAAMMGRGGARKFLVQIVIAQTALVIATFVLTPKTRWAPIEVKIAEFRGDRLAQGESPDNVEQQVSISRTFARGISVAQLVLRSAIAALIVVALTRPRARAFYDAHSERPTEG
jgi:hypothetical protein